LVALAFGCDRGDSRLILGATTSIDDSGILQELIDVFEDESEYNVTPVIAGSGQILELGRRGELDVTFTHSPAEEADFVTGQDGVNPILVMENWFLVVGPSSDPAMVASASDPAAAFQRIAAAEESFISRGDESGTNQREMAIWGLAGVSPTGRGWYQESAVGQGQNLLVANDKEAYTLVDSATYSVLRERIDLVVHLKDDVLNRYSAIEVSSETHDSVNGDAATAFIDFLGSARAREIVRSFGRETYGEPLFYEAGSLAEPPVFPFPIQ
jgi:tungstate transport system substrate-binding protein